MNGNQETCEITVGGQLHVGEFPRAPVRFKLQRALQDALGFTDWDRKEMTNRGPDDDPIVPSGEGDEYAVPMIYFAAVGICWPEPIQPTFRQCKHDPITFGEVVFEHFLEKHGDRPKVVQELQDEGRRLLAEMVARVTSKIAAAMKEEAGNSGAQEATSTTG